MARKATWPTSAARKVLFPRMNMPSILSRNGSGGQHPPRQQILRLGRFVSRTFMTKKFPWYKIFLVLVLLRTAWHEAILAGIQSRTTQQTRDNATILIRIINAALFLFFVTARVSQKLILFFFDILDHTYYYHIPKHDQRFNIEITEQTCWHRPAKVRQ